MHTMRPFEARDFEACLSIFTGNTPDFFDPTEEADFREFLEAADTPYLVIETGGRLVACGGYVIVADKRAAGLCWGMVSKGHQKTGLGAQLLTARLDAIRASGEADRVLIDTSQKSAPFFSRFGFTEIGRITDGYGLGLDQIDMALTL